MNWHNWLRAVACSGLLLAAYADAAHRDEAAHQDVLAAIGNVHAGWHP